MARPSRWERSQPGVVVRVRSGRAIPGLRLEVHGVAQLAQPVALLTQALPVDRGVQPHGLAKWPDCTEELLVSFIDIRLRCQLSRGW